MAQLLRSYKVVTEPNQLKGIEAATLIMVLDQHGICWADTQISRDEFDSSRDYHKAVEDRRHALKEAWPDEYYSATEHACEGITTADGHGAYCKHCGDTLA